MQLLKNFFEKKEIKPDSNSISNDFSILGESEVKVSELFYRRLFEAAQDGILIIDADSGRIVDVNPFLLDLLDYSHTDFVGKPLWPLDRLKIFGQIKQRFRN